MSQETVVYRPSMASLSLTVKTLLPASGKAITALSAVLATVILTRALTRADYATHKQVLLVFSMASPLLMMGLLRALYYFLPGEEKRPRAVLLENLLSLFIGAGLDSRFYSVSATFSPAASTTPSPSWRS